MTARPNTPDDWDTVVQPDLSQRIETASRVRPLLRWTAADGAHSHVIDDRAVLGASESADVRLTDRSVSRLHAEVERRADGLWVRDLDSTNGTFIRGVRVREAMLAPGDRLRIGTTDIEIADEREPSRLDLWPTPMFGPLVGPSSPMRELFARIAKVAASDLTVLIEGETGTGKELVARALHEASPRRGHPMVTVDCGALPENLLEAELFGHAKGAFTGAANARVGAIEDADGGTLFLDEVGELPLSMQPKLLRVLESRTIRRLGENQHRPVNVRFVSATHRNLRRMVSTGAFREDLYFRLAVVPLQVPALRERPGDIPALVARFTPAGAREPLSDSVVQDLCRRPWIGNVRELRNYVERASVLGPELAEQLAKPLDRTADGGTSLPTVPLDRPFKAIRDEWIEHLEREYVRGLMALHGNNIPAVAEVAGLDRTYVYRLVKKHGL